MCLLISCTKMLLASLLISHIIRRKKHQKLHKITPKITGMHSSEIKTKILKIIETETEELSEVKGD